MANKKIIRNVPVQHDPEDEFMRKRLRLKKHPRHYSGLYEVSPEKLQTYWEDRDAKLLQDKREDIKRRKKIVARVKKFEELLKEKFGRQLKVRMLLNERTDELNLLTYFTPKGNQPLLDSDEAVHSAFKKSKLNELMTCVGSGAFLASRERDIHFMEKKWRAEKV